MSALRDLRKSQRRKQEDVAAFLGISTRQLRRFETGEAEPGRRSLLALSVLYGVDVSELEADVATPTTEAAA